MKVALISPIENLEMIKDQEMHMVLTHLVHSNNTYAAFYAQEKGYKILDNGAFEDSLNDIESVVKAAQIVSANEIILPDIIYEGQATIDKCEEAIEYLCKEGITNKYKLMAVPQGKDEKEWWNCFEYFNKHFVVDVIGLSKLSCPKAFSLPIADARLKITKEMTRHGLTASNKQYHLLGGSFDVLREIKKHPAWIRSIDTSAPFEFGKRRISLKNATEDYKGKASLEVGVKGYNMMWVKKAIKDVRKVEEASNDNKS